MKGLIALGLALQFSQCFAAGDHDAPQSQGGMQAGVQPKAKDVQERFNRELDEFFESQRPGSGVSPDLKDRILQRVAGMSDNQREEFLNRYMQLDDLKHKMQELKKTDPTAAWALLPQIMEQRQALWQIDPDVTRMLGRAYFGSTHSDGMRDWPHGRPGPDQIRDAKDWARIGKDDEVIQRGVGDILKAGGDLQGAAQAYHRAVSINPKDGKALTGLSQVQADSGNYEAAVETAKRALEVDPRNAVAYGVVKMYKDRAAPVNEVQGGGQAGGQVSGTQFFDRQTSAGDYGRAAAPVEIRQDSAKEIQIAREVTAAIMESRRRLSINDTKGAVEAANRALMQEPRNTDAYWALYQAYLKQKNFEGALKAADMALAVDPFDKRALNGKSMVLSMLGDYKDALTFAEKALSVDPNFAGAYVSKALALGGLGQREAGVQALGRAAALDPQYAKYYNAAMAGNDDLVSLLTGERPGGKPAPKPQPEDRRFRWGLVAGGVLAGLLMVVLGISQGGTLVTNATRGLSRLGSASPAVQPMPVGTPAPAPAEGLAASGIRIEKKIGQGGMGVVYQGMDTSLERPVAIKKMREEIRSDIREKDRFIKEAKTVAALRHPNIVEIYSIIEDGADVYLVFEYVTGKTVHDLTYERGALPAAWAIGVIRAVASALDYAHKKGVVHRDLKPSNIMVEEDGMVKVMDFGVARMAKDSLSRMSMTNTVVGTPPYMAPEQEQGIVRKESDVYALAVCLYEMVTGTLPFQGMGAGMLMAKLNGTYVPASRVIQGLPEGFDAVMAQALAPDPDKRLHTAGDFAAALSTLPV